MAVVFRKVYHNGVMIYVDDIINFQTGWSAYSTSVMNRNNVGFVRFMSISRSATFRSKKGV